MGDPAMFTADQVSDLVKTAVTEGIKAANTVNPSDRPAAAVSNVNLKKYGLPRMGVAMKAMYDGGFRQSQEFERDFHQATKELFGYSKPDKDDSDPLIESAGAAKNARSLFWAKTRGEMIDVLDAMGEKASAKSIDRIDGAIKAMAEGSGSAGGYLVPTQYLQDRFEYALVSTIALRQVPGVEVLPVTSNVVAMPRESTAAGASEAAEAGTLTAQDATLSQQSITVKKQYGFRRYSNELLADANPAWMEFLARTLVRDVALEQDKEYLQGSGSGTHITGLINYSSLTTGPNLGTNGRSPTFDDIIGPAGVQYLLRAANSEPNFIISHPRVLASFQSIKDSTGNYLMVNQNGYNVPGTFGTGLAGAPPKAFLAGALGMWFSSQLSIAQTAGSSTDCTTAIVGDASKVVILERSGIEVAFSEHLYFNSDETAARAIGRSAVAVTQPAAVALITGIRA